jgi:Leucine-rich repeat (LRR) protein
MFIAIGLLPVGRTAIAQDQTEMKVLTFPADRPMGILYAGPVLDSGSKVNWFGGFQPIGPATGQVSVPANALVRLDVSLDACNDLSPLAQLGADDLHGLRFASNSPVHGQLQHIARLSGLRWIEFESCAIGDDDAMHLAGLKNLESIYFSTYTHTGRGITDSGMKAFKDLSRLRVLSLRGCPVTDEGLQYLSSCKSLEILSLDDSRVTGPGLDNLLMAPDLKHLSLGVYDEGSPVDDEGLKTVCQLTSLESLSLAGTQITDEGLPHLQSLVNLRDLTLDNTRITDEGLGGLIGLDRLEELRFYRQRGEALGDVAAKNLARLPKLKKVTAAWQLSPEGIATVATMKNLTEFSFLGSVTDAQMELISGMASLESLWLQNCPITDGGFAKIGQLQNLKQLRYHGLKITPDSLAVISRLPNLKHLSATFEFKNRCKRPGAAWRTLESMPNLESLKIGGLLIDDEQWSILAALPNLTSLTVDSNVPLGSGFFRAVSQLGKLTSLDVREAAPGKSDLSRLAELPDLEYVDMSGDLGALHLDQLARIPRLRSVQLSTSQPLTGSEESLFAKQCKSLQSFILRQLEAANPHSVSADGVLLVRWATMSEALNSMTGQPAPAISVNRPVNFPPDVEPGLASFRGGPVLVYFWQSFPPEITQEDGDTLAVADAEKQFRDRGLKVFCIHRTDGAANMAARMRDLQMKWPTAVDVEGQSATAWHASGRNCVYLLDAEGNIRMAQVYLGDLERALEVLMAEHEASRNRNGKK